MFTPMEFLNGFFNYCINLSKWIIWTDSKVSQVKLIYLAFIQDSPILEKENKYLKSCIEFILIG